MLLYLNTKMGFVTKSGSKFCRVIGPGFENIGLTYFDHPKGVFKAYVPFVIM